MMMDGANGVRDRAREAGREVRGSDLLVQYSSNTLQCIRDPFSSLSESYRQQRQQAAGAQMPVGGWSWS